MRYTGRMRGFLSQAKPDQGWKKWHFWAFFGFVVVLSYLTYFHRYWEPPYVFWDENYHIASAQKYLHGTYFMEQHPPLGKLLVAAGESIFRVNAQTDQFLGTDYGTDFPVGFSFVGYRFFSALLSWWTAPLLFLCFWFLTRRNPLAACLLSFLYIFDNALVVHSRGAMLEGPLMCFATLVILAFFLLYERPTDRRRFLWCAALFGASLALAVTTKVLGLIFLAFIPVLLWRDVHPTDRRPALTLGAGMIAVVAAYLGLLGACAFAIDLQLSRGLEPAGPFLGLQTLLSHPWFVVIALLAGAALSIRLLWLRAPASRRAATFLAVMTPAFLLVYCGVWGMHFTSGRAINPVLPDQGFYQASPEYKAILAPSALTSADEDALRFAATPTYRAIMATGGPASPIAFPFLLRDSLKFVGHYNAGAPRLDLCKTDENGSPFWFWPLGARSINYRWETPGLAENQAPETQVYRYLYLQANPVVWWSALAGVLLAVAMLVGSVLFPPRLPMRRRLLLALFTGLYLAYLLAVSRIERVMYLYHYFLPLLFGFFVLALVLDEIQTLGRRGVTETMRLVAIMVLAGLCFVSFQFYKPFTYYQPLTDAQVERRAIFSLWELRCVNCTQESPLLVPSRQPGQ